MEKEFFGHPRALATLFFTEMWERFSYYGMRALLLLYMVTSLKKGGLGFPEAKAGALYGLYTMLVYLLALPGGWIADNVLGLRRTIFYGACIITAGHFLLIFSSLPTFFLGLLLIVIGTGMLKPNISTLVGELYLSSDDARRDAGYSIFFMGINVGAFVAPFITGYFGEKVNWHIGFAIAGLGMLVGLLQFYFSQHRFGSKGLSVYVSDIERRRAVFVLAMGIFLIAAIVTLIFSGVVLPDPIQVASTSAYVISICALLYFGYLFFIAKLDQSERKNVFLIGIYFIASIVFYMGYEQQGSSLNLFALRYTQLTWFGFDIPASWFQAMPAVAVLIFAPFFAWLWIWLKDRQISPPTAMKLSFGLFFVGLSFLVMGAAASFIGNGNTVLPWWLIVTYVLHTFGEICLYPVGLSAVKKLAPKKYSGQLMGVWFLSLSLGNLIAGMVAGRMSQTKIALDPNILVSIFMTTAVIILFAGLIIFMVSRFTPVRLKTV
jgi:POT family proton-dependent oligopeptide transporter